MQAQATEARSQSSGTDLATALAAIVGAAHVRADEAVRRLHSEDIWLPARAVVALVVSPGSLDEAAAVVAAAHAAGFAIAPRGAGMSYTGGYVPATERTISLDMSRMNRILRVSREDMTVTVEAGVTWRQLNDTLAGQNLRTPFWGPMSGLTSTIGGGLSQLNAMFGAGHHGTTSESVIALSVILADGRVLRTGARGADGRAPFYRHFGPDLAGIFCGDCGALGIKAEITLRLMTAPAFEDHASLSFPTGQALLLAMAEITRAGIAAETCAFDPGLTEIRLRRASLATDIKTLSAVVASQKSIGKGILAAARIAIGGRNFVPENDYPLHVTCEGRSKAAVEADMAELRRIASAAGGIEIENSIAKVIRAMPFPPLNSMVGPTGEAWVPIHGLCPLSDAPAILTEIQALYAERAADMADARIHTGFLFSHMSTNAIIIEPVFFWQQGWRPIHESAIEPSHLARLTPRGEDAAGRAIVEDLRKAVLAIFARHGCGHFQIGRTYPYRESRDAASRALLDAIKGVVDPDGAINPGVLGFATPEPRA